jgi:Uma2 family endonuclease
MVSTAAILSSPQAMGIGEQRVVFRNLTWQAYQQILAAVGNNRAALLTYDRGILEITMPLELHEFAARMIELFVRILVEELGFNLKTMGSTTLNYPDLDRGAEPDNAYYIQNQARVTGKVVDLAIDPPPDLVVEVDITYTGIHKLNLYASMGIPEFWRYNSKVLRIYQLQGQAYVESTLSSTFSVFSSFPKERFYQFLEQCQQNEVQGSRDLRSWVQQQLQDRP